MKIDEYELVTGMSIDALQRFVNTKIKTGWFPIGGPFVEVKEHYQNFVQAMGKEKGQKGITILTEKDGRQYWLE